VQVSPFAVVLRCVFGEEAVTVRVNSRGAGNVEAELADKASERGKWLAEVALHAYDHLLVRELHVL
jgi:hypothetical protein